MVKTRFLDTHSWRTLEWFWRTSATAFFRAPAGARIRVFYGCARLGLPRQHQTLDGLFYRKLTVTPWSVCFARMQMYVERDQSVTYDVYLGTTAATAPNQRF